MTVKTMTGILLLAILTLPACATGADGPVAGKPADSAPSNGDPIDLRLDQPRTIADTTLTWTALSDSRCPKGVNCMWAGEVTVSLTVTEGKAEPKAVELKLSPRSSEEGDPSKASTTKWNLQLLAVEPYPDQTVKTDRAESVARVTMTPR